MPCVGKHKDNDHHILKIEPSQFMMMMMMMMMMTQSTADFCWLGAALDCMRLRSWLRH
jgi:hypothetical protein